MGLAISRSIIEAHDGRLWAENHPDGGAVFVFEIPVRTKLTQPVWRRRPPSEESDGSSDDGNGEAE
jgi:signal transduction histidine kinase